MRSLRFLFASLLGLAVVLASVVAAAAVLGRIWWGSAGWYYPWNSGSAYRLHCGQELLHRGDADRVDQIALSLQADGYNDHAALLRGESWFRQANQYVAESDPQRAAPLLVKALEEFNKIRDKGSIRLEAAVFVGQCYLHLKRPASAEHAFQFVLSERPDDIDAHRGLAAIYFDQGAVMRAVHHLEKVAQLDPQDGRPYRLMGLIYKEIPEYTQAVACYREALGRCFPGHNREQQPAVIRAELAECLVKQTNYAEALEVVEQIDSLPDDDGALMALRAECLVGLGRQAAARRLLDEALAVSSNNVNLFRLRAKVHLESKEAAAAAALLERALGIDRQDYASRYQLVQAYQQLGRPAEAAQQQRLLDQTQKDMRTLSELNREAMSKPWDGSVRLRLVELCERLDKPDLAAMWRRAADSCPPMADPRHRGLKDR